MKLEFREIFEYKVIYIFSINTEKHKEILKIGDTTLQWNKDIELLLPNCSELNKVAKDRIKQYTTTAGIDFNLLHTELAVRKREIIENGKEREIIEGFRDYDVHRVLLNSGIERIKFENKGREWFKVDLETAKEAIRAVKNGRNSLNHNEIKKSKTVISFRPEQTEAINKTVKHLKKGKSMLWNAKMRFGKTLTSLEVIRQSKFKRTIIITHRPAVIDGWYEDFTKIFSRKEDIANYDFVSKTRGEPLETILTSEKNIVCFASIQDLRGSDIVGGNFDKNNEIFKLNWDFVIVDEAHEGTTTELGKKIIKELVKEETKILSLSGTPFNILDNYEDDAIYTWDYIMEQEAKKDWYENNYGDSNPYDELPEMKIYTYSLGELLKNNRYIDLEDKAFNFREFFRVWTGDKEKDGRELPEGAKIGDFCNENDVKSFLKLLTKSDKESHYPFSKERYRDIFKHTFWVVPGVKEAKALSALMKKDEVFGNGMFEIVNIAGEGDEEEKSEEALQKVKKAIKEAGDNYTITLSCGKLTTGVTIPEWTGVFMLSGSYSTSASTYLQTIFRVQSPYKVNGKTKRYCYVFDFAPDRALKMVSEAVALSNKAGKTKESDRVKLGKFLNFCPVIAIQGTKMKEYDTSKLLQQLKKVYAEKAVKNGFDDNSLYNDKLLKLDSLEIEEFNKLKKIVGTTKASEKLKEIDINRNGFTDEEYEAVEKIEKKKKHKELEASEKELLERWKKQLEEKRKAISILRSVSIRMPLLIYGIDMDINDEVTMEDLVEKIDNSSWEEFMPVGVTKNVFKFFMKYYDKDIFISAGRKIRETVLSADKERVLERIKKIVTLFSYFKNPDKETVLTPWRVVNMHMGDCLGGYNFFDEKFENILEEPRYLNKDEVTKNTFENLNSKILEINSKTGLYPLYLTYSLFRKRCENYSKEELTKELEDKLWLETIEENIYIICKTPMAKLITTRTLVGFKNRDKIKVNAHYFDDLINMFQNKRKQFVEKVSNTSFWKKKGSEKMKFDAIVGNPPYQENLSKENETRSLSKQLFPTFIMTSILLDSNYVSLLTPSRWFTADAQDKSFIKLREFFKANNHLKEIYNFPDNKILFKKVEIAGGVNYFLYDKKHTGNVTFVECYNEKRIEATRPLFENGLSIILSMNSLTNILEKVKNYKNFISLTTITQGRDAFGIEGKVSKLEKSTQKEAFDGAIEVRCAYEEIRYILKEKITKNQKLVNKWKIFTSKGNGGAGILTDEKKVSILGKSYIGKPNSVCTDSLIPIGNFESEIEAINLQKYMCTKFLRFVVGILKTSQNLYQNVYQFVPLQDFTENSDIDWSKNIDEIDEQLFVKYGLSDEEKEYIRNKIKDMV